MTQSRFSDALSDGAVTLPETGKIAIYNATPEINLDPIDRERAVLIQPNFPAHKALEVQGWTVEPVPTGTFAAAVIFVPREKDLARAWIRDGVSRLAACGLVIVDGQKTDGCESLLKAIKRAQTVDGVISKAHGKLFWFPKDHAFGDWPSLSLVQNKDGFWTAPGVFSADGVDPASALLLANLPSTLGGQVADLGAGWGVLARGILGFDAVTACHLVEANHAALTAARENVTDPRALFHWDDATNWTAPEPLDAVIMNPPFHSGRRASPDLGRAFIDAAARNLKPSGVLCLVANRHLPYEEALREQFGQVDEVAGDNRFKLLTAGRRRKDVRRNRRS